MSARFQSRFQNLPKVFFEEVEPTPLREPKLAALSSSCEELLNLKIPADQLLSWLNGQIRLSGDQRISSRYAGHQFGHWAGQLGDGRAISIAEIQGDDGQFWEIQTKGSGLTPFSRMGDGKAVIRSSVREFLVSEAMQALGVPTTRALALVVGRDAVYREQVERSALVARVFPSNLRFGHFEYAFHFREPEALNALAEYTRTHYFPECQDHLAWLEQVVERTAFLIAKWQSLGFEHGVMNTDNMSILGLTIDYGPFGFMERYNPDWICNHTDEQGRYRFQNQPVIAMWNLDRLFWCFSEMIEPEKLKELLFTFEDRFAKHWQNEMNLKLGLQHSNSVNEHLIEDLLQIFKNESRDWTSSFRDLAKSLPLLPEEWKSSPALTDWHAHYLQILQQEGTKPAELRSRLLKVNPKYILRNSIAQKVIADVEKDDFQSLQAWLKVLSSPYDEHPEYENNAKAPPPDAPEVVLSCSS